MHAGGSDGPQAFEALFRTGSASCSVPSRSLNPERIAAITEMSRGGHRRSGSRRVWLCFVIAGRFRNDKLSKGLRQLPSR